MVFIKSISQEFSFNDMSLPNDSHDQLFTLYAGYEAKLYQFDKWLMEGTAGDHVIYFDNVHDYNWPESLARKPLVGGVFYNTQANSLIREIDLTWKASPSG